MRPWSRRARTRLVGIALAVALTGAAPAAGAAPEGGRAPGAVAAVTTGEISFIGHGWGHGRGMGQYGALGYAVDDGWAYDRILLHYYGGTRLAGDAGNSAMSVELTRLTAKDTIVQGPGLTVNGTTASAGYGYLLVRRVAAGVFQTYTAPSCGGPWTAWGATRGSGLSIATTGDQGVLGNLLRTCEVGISYGYRGTFSVVEVGGTVYTHNNLPTESYLRGVVPRESPASWGALGGGRGLQALKAQAVAARSYALSSAPRASGARVCDTTACQVYLGAFTSGADGPSAPLSALENAATDTAIGQTAGQVMRFTSSGAIARTEFSSSTGGWTTGGTFPAVEDLGDDISINPNHTWTATFTEAEVAARLGISGVRSVTVTARNGLGDLGGRVTQVVVVDGAGASRTWTGAAFRTATDRFKSDWFAVSSMSRAQAESIVKALYADLLGRPVDATGLATWSARLMAGTSQSDLVNTLTRSAEYIRLRISQAYQDVLGRPAEPAGMTYWSAEIIAGRATVDDVQRRFYDSQEFYNRSGGTAVGYVDLLYRSMFDRPASAAESAAWAAQIAVIGRSRVVDGIWFSLEAAMYRAGGYYRVFLQREPDRAGQEYWARVLLAQGEGAVRMGIAGSVEYRILAQSRFP